MRFLEIISNKRFVLISVILLIFVSLNLFEGDRGIISYYNNKQISKQLIEERENLNEELKIIEKKNDLLTKNLDLDYLEILYRTKFMMGKSEEKIIKIK